LFLIAIWNYIVHTYRVGIVLRTHSCSLWPFGDSLLSHWVHPSTTSWLDRSQRGWNREDSAHGRQFDDQNLRTS